MKHSTFLASVCAIVLAAAGPARAQGAPGTQDPQDGGPDPSTVRIRMGPLWMNPAVSLTNLGVDQNVFNVAPDQGPKKDFTATLEQSRSIPRKRS